MLDYMHTHKIRVTSITLLGSQVKRQQNTSKSLQVKTKIFLVFTTLEYMMSSKSEHLKFVSQIEWSFKTESMARLADKYYRERNNTLLVKIR